MTRFERNCLSGLLRPFGLAMTTEHMLPVNICSLQIWESRVRDAFREKPTDGDFNKRDIKQKSPP